MSCSLRKEATNKAAPLLQVPDPPVNPTGPTPLSIAIAHPPHPRQVPQAASAKPTPPPVRAVPQTGQLSHGPASDQRLRTIARSRCGNLRAEACAGVFEVPHAKAAGWQCSSLRPCRRVLPQATYAPGLHTSL